MDYRDKVNDKLGEENVQLFYNVIKSGNIDDTRLKNIGGLMHPYVNGTFQNKRRECSELVFVAQYMLDTWHLQELYEEEVDGVVRLKEIFLNPQVDLKDLAKSLKSKNAKLDIGLPKEHPKLPMSMETGQPALISHQGQDAVCAGHAVTKAIVEIIDKHGFDCDQKKIQDDLVDTKCARNPDYFDKTKLRVNVTKKDDEKVAGFVEVQIGIKTVASSIENDFTFNPCPLNPLPKGKEMVLRWDIGMTLADKKIFGNHAIFAKHFHDDDGTFDCINSWGKNEMPYPKINKSRIYAIDYVSIIEK